MTDTLTKGNIFKDDFSLWDGSSIYTGSRKTSTGGTQTLKRLDWPGVDVYAIYGAKTNAELSTAAGVINTAKAELWLSPGEWTITENLSLAANIKVNVAPGATINVSNGITFTVNGFFEATAQQLFTGTGTIVFSGGIRAIKGEWFGSSKNYAALNNMLTVMGSTNKYKVELSADTWTIDDDLDLSSYSNLHFDIPKGCVFNVSNTKTLTFYNPAQIDASKMYQIFSGSGTIAFNNSGIIYPEWWGAIGDNSTDDTVAVYNAIQASGQMICKFYNQYKITSTALAGATAEKEIQIPAGATIIGHGPGQSAINITSNQLADGTRLEFIGDNVTIRDIKISEVNAVLSRANVYGSLSGVGADNIIIDNVEINGANGAAMHFRDCKNGRIANCKITNTKADGIHINYGSEDWQIINCKITEVEDDAIGFVSEGEATYGAVEGLTVTNCILGRQQNDTTGSGVAIVGGRYAVITNNFIEQSGDAGVRIAYWNDAGVETVFAGHIVISNNIIKSSGQYSLASLPHGLSATNCRDVTIDNNLITDSVGSGITISDSCVDVSITNNRITNSGDRGIWGSSTANVGDYLELWTDAEWTDGRSEAFVANHGLIIRNNIVQTSETDGVYISGTAAANNLFYEMIFEGNQVLNSNMGNAAGKYGIYIAYCDDATVINNYAGASGSATALSYKWIMNDGTCTGNIVYGGNQPGNTNYVKEYGDEAATITIGQSGTLLIWRVALTADRAVTLATTDALTTTCHKFKIVRTAAGAFNLNVGAGPLKALAANEWCEVSYAPSTGWLITAYGAL